MTSGPTGRKRLTLLAGLCLSCAAAHAQEVDLNLGLSSALLVRGVALGNARPALQGGVSVSTADGWLVSLGVAALRPSADEGWTEQVHARLGHAFRLDDDWSAQVAAVHYAYPFDDYLRPFERDELGATLAWRDQVFASVTGLRQARLPASGHRGSIAWDLVLRQPLGRWGDRSLALGAGLGHLDPQHRPGASYNYGHLGLSGRIGDVQLDLSRVVTDSQARERFGAAADSRWVASLGIAF